MKKFIILLITVITGFTMYAQDKAGKKNTTHHEVAYTCPMHPEVTSSKPGKCPKCGMKLISKEMKKKGDGKNS